MSTKTFNIKPRIKYEQAVWEQNKKLDVNIFFWNIFILKKKSYLDKRV